MPTIGHTGEWTSLKPSFAWDGSLRDLIIINCTVKDWSNLFGALDHCDGAQLVYPSSGRDFWDDPQAAFSRYRGSSILLNYRGINMKCDLVSPEIIEFDVDPRSITDQPSLNSLILAMQIMANVTKKRVLLTEEGDHNSALLEVQPDIS